MRRNQVQTAQVIPFPSPEKRRKLNRRPMPRNSDVENDLVKIVGFFLYRVAVAEKVWKGEPTWFSEGRKRSFASKMLYRFPELQQFALRYSKENSDEFNHVYQWLKRNKLLEGELPETPYARLR